MKSYNHLWEPYLTQQNYDTAVVHAMRRKSRKKKRRLLRIKSNPDIYRPKLLDRAANYKNDEHTPVHIYDGTNKKPRTIIVPTAEEQIIHHMIINVMKPIFMKGMYDHSYGSIPGRGSHRAKKVVEKWIRHDHRNCKYCLKMDIRKFFDSVPHDVLKRKLAKVIHDERFLRVLYEVIDVTDTGLPLGFYTSQWFANWYLQDLDHYIKEQLGASYYVRYMDDMVVFGSNKKKLHQICSAIDDYLRDELGLEMKSNWQVYRFDYIVGDEHHGRDLDFMGFRFYRDRTILRKSILLRATRKAKRISKKPRATVYDMRQMLSFLGWLDCTMTYKAYQERIKPYVDFGKYKRAISKYDSAHNKLKGVN